LFRGRLIFSDISLTLISQGVHPLEASNKGGVGKAIFEQNASISRKR